MLPVVLFWPCTMWWISFWRSIAMNCMYPTIIYAMSQLLLSPVLGLEFANSMFSAGGNSGVQIKFSFPCIAWFRHRTCSIKWLSITACPFRFTIIITNFTKTVQMAHLGWLHNIHCYKGLDQLMHEKHNCSLRTDFNPKMSFYGYLRCPWLGEKEGNSHRNFLLPSVCTLLCFHY